MCSGEHLVDADAGVGVVEEGVAHQAASALAHCFVLMKEVAGEMSRLAEWLWAVLMGMVLVGDGVDLVVVAAMLAVPAFGT